MSVAICILRVVSTLIRREACCVLGMQVLGLSTPRAHAVKALPRRLHVLHGSRVMECLFESSLDYAGVTGLFPVAMTAHEGATTAAIIISFASGSRALTAGGDAEAFILCLVSCTQAPSFFCLHPCYPKSGPGWCS